MNNTESQTPINSFTLAELIDLAGEQRQGLIYSLSCGGPIVAFGCDNLIITPVSPHNLNMRPLILPGNVQIRLKVESRSGDFMLSADSRMQRMSDNHELFISSGDFKMNVVKMPDHSYYETLRNKLNWGEDKRNKKDKS